MHPQCFLFPLQQIFVGDLLDFVNWMQQIDGHVQGGRAAQAAKQAHLALGGGVMGGTAVIDQAIQGVHKLGRCAPGVEGAPFDHEFQGAFTHAAHIDPLTQVEQVAEGTVGFALVDDQTDGGGPGIFDGAQPEPD